MTGDKSLLENIESLNAVTRIITAGNSLLEAISHGPVSLISSRKRRPRSLEFCLFLGLGSTSSQSPT